MFLGIGIGINRQRFGGDYIKSLVKAYVKRVTDAGGVVEAQSCVDAVSGLLLNASFLLIPSGFKEGKVYAENPVNGNGDLSFTRASDAWRTNASGLVQRTPWNLVQYSEQFSNGVYTKVATTITSNTTTAPNGTLTADKLVSTSVSSSHSVYQNLGSVGDTRVVSCFVKKAEYRYVTLQYGTASVRFDFDTLSFSGGTSNTYTDEGNGWYRISSLLTATVNARVTILIPDNSGNISYVGDDVSGTFVWGFQAVEGTTAQTYFPTTDRLNVPRLSYMYGSCPAVLLEPQRTNLALRSEEFDNATWVKTATSISANSTTSPDGNTTADTFSANGVTTFHIIEQSFTLTSGNNYTFSVYAKKNTNNFLQIIGGSANFSLNVWANFDLNNGAVGSVGSSATATITSVGNGWYRCTMTAQCTITGTGTSAFGIISASNSVRGELNSLSTSVYLWGAQLEAGAYPTTYIPTTSASATRIADAFTRNNIYTNGLISASGGTWFVELRGNVSYTRDASGASINIGDGTTNSLYFAVLSTGRLQLRKKVSNVETILYTTLTDTIKVAFKWNGTTADLFVNGTKQVSATAFTTTNMEFLAANTIDVPKFIQQMALWPTPLSDAQLIQETTL